MDDVRLLFGITPADWARTPVSVQEAYCTLLDVVSNLEARVQLLEAQARQTSRNSSKPPSSDPPSAPPPPPRTPRGRKAGAQPNHSDQQRPLVPPEQLDQIVVLRPSQCPHCQSELPPDLPPSQPLVIRQVWELPAIKPIITEYQQHTLCCPACQHTVTAALPADLPPGAFGPRATALMGLLHGRFRLSARESEAFLSEVCNLPLSTGAVVKSWERLSAALEPLDAEIQQTVQSQPHLFIDETSWREQQQRGWLWVAVSEMATCFRINPSRGQGALRELIGTEYRGIAHSDRASVYHALPDTQRQLCWAHIVRNLQGLVDYQHDESGWAGRMLGWSEVLFGAWRAYRCGVFDQIALQQALLPVRLALHDLFEKGAQSKWDKLQAVSEDLLRHWEALWTFSRVEGIEPTNNTAERALRPAVVWRKSCFGTQSAAGSRFVERMLSVQATCEQQGRKVWDLLTQAVRAAWAGQPAPSLFTTP